MHKIPLERPKEGTAYQSLEYRPQFELIIQSLIFSTFISNTPDVES